jgi:hypothetical protein
MKLIIDTDELTQLKAEASKVILEPAAEQVLTRILELEEQVAQIKEAAKARLIEEGRKLNPNFKSWEADNVKVSMRTYGTKYYIKEAELDYTPHELFKTEATVLAPNTSIESVRERLKDAGFTVTTTKGKDGSERLDIKRVVDSKAVDKWVKERNALPTGIGEFTERPVALSFGLKNKEENDQ